MKKLFIFLTFLLCLLLFNTTENSDSSEDFTCGTESVIKENFPTSQQSIEILSKELKSNNFLIPRRHIQVVPTSGSVHVIQQLTKLLRGFRLKSEERLCKIFQFNSYCETIKLSSLLSSRKYHIYALRKIVI